jgi:hypothetical protein
VKADDLLPKGALDDAAGLIREAWLKAARRSLALVGDQVGKVPRDLDDPGDPLRRLIDEQAGKRIVAIEEATRRRVAGYVDQATHEGMSPGGLAKLIEDDASGAFGKARAIVIARTETGTAYNLASLEGYRASERVEHVQIFDGDDCGWTEHDDPDLADGSVRTLDEAEDNPLSHPNCVRAWAPVVGSERRP